MKPLYMQLAILAGYFAFMAGMWITIKKFLERVVETSEKA